MVFFSNNSKSNEAMFHIVCESVNNNVSDFRTSRHINQEAGKLMPPVVGISTIFIDVFYMYVSMFQI